MPWFKVDDGMLDHPKWKRAIRGAGSAALHMWVALGTWSSRHLTDGLVPADMVSEAEGPRGKRTRERALRVLAECRLVIRHIDGSVLVHDYLDYNPSRAVVLAERARKAKNKEDWKLRREGTGSGTGSEPAGNHVPSPPRPLPVPIPLSHQNERVPERALVVCLQDASEPERGQTPDPAAVDATTRLLGPSKREQAREAAAAALNGTQVLRHKFRADWLPTDDHRARGIELGLSEEQILDRAADCRLKPISHGFFSEDEHFERELVWLARDEEKARHRAHELATRKDVEMPGHRRRQQ